MSKSVGLFSLEPRIDEWLLWVTTSLSAFYQSRGYLQPQADNRFRSLVFEELDRYSQHIPIEVSLAEI